jgi:hypothetical protein
VSLAAVLAFAPPAMADDAPHKTGLLRLPPDQLVSYPAPPVYRDFVPAAVDLSSYFPRIGDQGAIGSCVAWASGYAARAFYARMVENRDGSDLANYPSPAFIYNATKEKGPPDDPCNGGTFTPNALTLLKQHGAGSLKDFPYDGTACPDLTPAQLAQGTDFRIEDFALVGTWDKRTGVPAPDTIDAIKAELAQGNPVIVGMGLNDAFQAMHGPAGQSLWNPGPFAANEKWQGHEVTLVGYDDALQAFKFINSWGPEWGDNGFGRVTYQAFLDRAGEAWVLRFEGDPQVPLQATDFRPDIIGPGPKLKTDANVGKAGADATVEVAGLWCGQVEVSGKPGARAAHGFVGSPEALASLKTDLGDGVDTSAVEVAPWPLCETRLALAASLDSEGAPTLGVAADGKSATIAGSAGHLYLVTYDAAGNAHIASTNAGSVPVGTDASAVLLLASEGPLLANASADESARDFLNALRSDLAAGTGGAISARLVVLN